MNETDLTARARAHLGRLCGNVPHRAVGSAWNHQATDYFAGVLRSLGWETRTPQFECIDWEAGETRLRAGEDTFKAYPSPFTLGWQGIAPLVAAGSLEELRPLDLSGKICLLHGELTAAQLAPKDYPFYSVEEHQEIIRLLEGGGALAVIAATGRDLQMVGNLYPFPLFEDGNFNVPSCYITDVDGERLLGYVGQEIKLSIEAQRLPSRGCNVNAIKGDPSRRIVVCAHIDSKIGTPGANDNASGVVALLLLAELLRDYRGENGVELVALNGEDHYSAAGELLYLRENQGKLGEILLAINLDDVGYIKGKNAYSFYNLPAELEQAVRSAFALHPDLAPGEQWYQSDHMVFVQNGVPAMAVTSDRFEEMMQTITHTPQDTIELVDPAKLARLALALRDLVTRGLG
jgi:aminopeptidase YwaD